MRQFRLIPAFLVVTVFATASVAAPVTFGSSGLVSPDVFLDFENAALIGAVITTQFSASGVTFGSNVSGAFWSHKTFGPATFDGITGDHLFRSGPAATPDMSIHFSRLTTDALFNFKAAGGIPWTLTSLRGGTVVETVGFTALNNNPNSFFGFTGSAFDEIRIVNGRSAGFELDHLQFNVPEPASLALLGLGVLAVVRKRRKKQSA